MKKDKKYDKRDSSKSPVEKYHFKLYVTGSTPNSIRAVANTRAICDRLLARKYDIEVIDLYEQPQLARADRIIATPTLVKTMPFPMRRITGDLSCPEKIITGLDLKKTDKIPVK